VLPLPTKEELAEDAVSTSGAEAPGYLQPPRFGEAETAEGADSADAFPPASMPTAYEPDASEAYESENPGEPAEDEAFDAGDEGYASLAGTRIERDPAAAADEDSGEDTGDEALELTFEAEAEKPEDGEGEPPADELLLDASRLAEADGPVQGGRRRRILGSGAEDGETPPPHRRSAPPSPPPGGSTLFERMANLSRASARRDDEDEDDDESNSGSLRIPRFLGRQNNQ